jgi:glycosyltransferase involved in cell wall biosynthesis
MRILVSPHDLAIGGSQLNAIDLAEAMRDRGHDVLLYGRPGVLVQNIRDRGLEFVQAPHVAHRPGRAVFDSLTDLIDERGLEVLHGYEWPPALDAVLAARARPGVAPLATVMSMSVAPFIPRNLPLVVGTEQIAAVERKRGRGAVTVIEPPVDLRTDQASLVDGDGFLRRHGLDDGTPCIVVVSRLAQQLKLEGILSAIEGVGRIPAPVRLVIAGDGVGRQSVEDAAARVNAQSGARRVVVLGELADPRPAYAAADAVLGMGGSALRALAYAKPLIVQGEAGFFRLLTPATVDEFLWRGWYGVGGAGAQDFAAAVQPLLADQGLREELGAYSLGLVRDRFSLERAAELQEAVYEDALDRVREHPIRVEFGSVARFARYHVATRIARLGRGGAATDDFNARPVAARAVRERA